MRRVIETKKNKRIDFKYFYLHSRLYEFSCFYLKGHNEMTDTPSAKIWLYEPCSFFGELVTWRLETLYSHSGIELDGLIYSAVFPHTATYTPGDTSSPEYHELGIPPRKGMVFPLKLTPDQVTLAKGWCIKHLQSRYDLLSLIGWALRCQWFQSPHTYYCFEFVHAALVAAGVLPVNRSFITGDQLMLECYEKGIVEYIPSTMAKRAHTQPDAPVRLNVE